MPRWPGLITTAAIGLGLAYASFSNALGNTAARSNPRLAARQLGANPTMPLRALDLAQLSRSSAEDRANAAAAARRALRAQALNPLALSVLGFIADGGGDSVNALKLLTDAHSMTRRTLITEIWLLEHAVSRDMIPETLAQYDIILRQSQDFQRLAFPILDAALADPAIEQAFKPYISAETPWMAEFLGSSAATSPAPNVVAGMLLHTGKVGKALELQLELPTLFRRLIETGHVDIVRPFYLAARKGPASLVASVELNDPAADPSIAPVSWRFSDDPSLLTQMLLGNGGANVINVKATNAKPQIAADKLLFLTPGRYRLSFNVEKLSGDSGSARWLAICVGASAPRLAAASGNVAGRDAKPRALDFEVGAGCDAVQLVLEVFDGADEGGLEINFGKLTLGSLGAPK